MLDPTSARALLGVDADDPPETVRRAWRAALRDHHPDRGGDPLRFAAVVEAGAALGLRSGGRPGTAATTRPAAATAPARSGGDPYRRFLDDLDAAARLRPLHAVPPGRGAARPAGTRTGRLFAQTLARHRGAVV